MLTLYTSNLHNVVYQIYFNLKKDTYKIVWGCIAKYKQKDGRKWVICNSVKKKKRERNRKDYGYVPVLRDLSPNKHGTFWSNQQASIKNTGQVSL